MNLLLLKYILPLCRSIPVWLYSVEHKTQMLVTDSLNHFSLSFDLFHEMLFKLFLHASNYNVFHFNSSQITYFIRKT